MAQLRTFTPIARSPMITPGPKFRATDRTHPDYPNCPSWAVEEFVDGAWSIYLVDWMPVYRPTRERAQELVDRLSHDESIDALQVRPRPDYWDRLNEPKDTSGRTSAEMRSSSSQTSESAD